MKNLTIRLERNKKNFVGDLDLQLVQSVHTHLDFTRPRVEYNGISYTRVIISSNQFVFCVIEAIPIAAVVRRRRKEQSLPIGLSKWVGAVTLWAWVGLCRTLCKT